MAKRWEVVTATAVLLLVAGCSARPAAQTAPVSAQPAPAAGQPSGTASGGSGGSSGSGGNALTGASTLTRDDEKIGQVYLGESADEVRDQLGAPLRQRSGGKTYIFWDYSSGLTVYLKPGGQVVWGMRVEKNWDGQTPRGLKLGDSEARLIQLYGQPNYKGKNLMIASQHAYVNDKTGVAISFDVNDGKVTGIQVLKLPEGTPLTI